MDCSADNARPTNRRRRRCVVACASAAMALHAPNVLALRTDYTLGTQAQYSDNIRLTQNNEQNDVVLSLLGGLLVEHTAADLDADIRGLMDYRSYVEDTFGNETLGSVNGNVEWRPLPGALHLVAQDYFTQTTVNSIAPETPANRVNTNALSVGPDIFFRPSPGNTVETQLRRSEYYFGDGPTAATPDSSRNSITAGWIRAVRPQLSLSAHAAYEDAQFDEQSQSDFSRMDYFLRGLYRRGQSELVADVGLSNIDRTAGEDVDGFLGRVTLGRQIRTNARLDLDLSAQYTDAGTDLLTTGGRSFAPNRTGTQVTGDIFFDRRVEARYRSGTTDRNWVAYVIARDEDYELTALDRRTRGLRFDVRRMLADAWYFNGHVQHRTEKYLDLGQTNKDSEIGLGLERQLTRKVTARLEYAFNTRNSDVVGGDYNENRVLLLVYVGGNPNSFR